MLHGMAKKEKRERENTARDTESRVGPWQTVLGKPRNKQEFCQSNTEPDFLIIAIQKLHRTRLSWKSLKSRAKIPTAFQRWEEKCSLGSQLKGLGGCTLRIKTK